MRKILLLVLVIFVAVGVAACGDDDDSDANDDVTDDDVTDDDVTDDDALDDDLADDDAVVDDDLLDDDTGTDDDVVPAYDPTQLGPYPVGNRTYLFVDPDRWDPATSSVRHVLTEVWYPAVDESTSLPRDVIWNFFGDWEQEVRDLLADYGIPPEEIENFGMETGSAREAPIRSDRGPYPLILFSHGNGGVRFQNFTLCEYLASHGFLVAAPDHTGNALVTPLPDQLVVFNEDLIFIAYSQRMHDFMFLIDSFTELNEYDPAGVLTGLIDLEHIGGMGHSFGGTAMVETTKRDPRIKATIDYASFMFPWFYGDFEASLMFMIGIEDNTMGDVNFLMRLAYNISPAPKFRLEFFDGGHYTFTDVCLLMPSVFGDGDGCGTGERRWTGQEFEFIGHDEAFTIINPYTTAFFGYNLRGEEHMAAYLYDNHAPDDIKYKFEFPE